MLTAQLARDTPDLCLDVALSGFDTLSDLARCALDADPCLPLGFHYREMFDRESQRCSCC
jgi:hypothetical protein